MLPEENHNKERTKNMQNTKRNIGLMAAAVVLAAGAGIASTAYLTQAKSGANNGANGIGGIRQVANKLLMRPVTMGTVTAVNSSSVTFIAKNGTSYTANTSTTTKIYKTVNGTKTTIQVSSIAVGDTVAVSGTVSGSVITASNIVDGTLPAKQQPAATGTVSNLSGNTFTLTNSSGTAYTVNASSLQSINISKSNTTLLTSGVQNGDMVSVFGTLSGGNIAATKIMDGKSGMGWGAMGTLGK